MTDDAISAWVSRNRMVEGKKSRDDSSCSSSKSGNRCKAGSYKAVEASSDCCQSQAQQRRCNNQPRYLPTDEMVVMEEIRQEEDDDDAGDGDDTSADAADSSPKGSKTDNSNSQLENSVSDQARTLRYSTAPLEDISKLSQRGSPPPCKLLSRLTTDDTAQAIAPSDDELEDPMSTEDGVPCSTAYKLLRRHATSDEKIDALARVLEGGCAPDSKGGCKVKHKIVAEALVDMCL